MSVEGYKAAIKQAKEPQAGPTSLKIRTLYAQIAQAEILEAIHQRLLNLALKGEA